MSNAEPVRLTMLLGLAAVEALQAVWPLPLEDPRWETTHAIGYASTHHTKWCWDGVSGRLLADPAGYALSSEPNNPTGEHMAKASELQRSPIHLLHRAGQCAADVFHAEIQEADLTPRQLAVLITVAENEGKSQTAIVERTGVDRSTLADIVARLQRKGLLQRRRTKEDARAYAVKLTDAGRRVLRKAEPLARRVDQRLLQALPEDHRDRFLDALEAVVATLQSAEKKR